MIDIVYPAGDRCRFNFHPATVSGVTCSILAHQVEISPDPDVLSEDDRPRYSIQPEEMLDLKAFCLELDK